MSTPFIPNDLILIISESLSTQSLAALMQTNHRFFHLLSRSYYDNAFAHLHKFPLLHWAAARSLDGVMGEILSRDSAKVNSFCTEGTTPLHAAAEASQPSAIAYLLSHGAKVDARRRETEETALHLAAVTGNVEVVKILLEHGADKSKTDLYGYTPLDVATWAGHRGIVDLLLPKTLQVATAVPALGWMNQKPVLAIEWSVMSETGSCSTLMVQG